MAMKAGARHGLPPGPAVAAVRERFGERKVVGVLPSMQWRVYRRDWDEDQQVIAFVVFADGSVDVVIEVAGYPTYLSQVDFEHELYHPSRVERQETRSGQRASRRGR